MAALALFASFADSDSKLSVADSPAFIICTSRLCVPYCWADEKVRVGALMRGWGQSLGRFFFACRVPNPAPPPSPCRHDKQKYKCNEKKMQSASRTSALYGIARIVRESAGRKLLPSRDCRRILRRRWGCWMLRSSSWRVHWVIRCVGNRQLRQLLSLFFILNQIQCRVGWRGKDNAE